MRPHTRTLGAVALLLATLPMTAAAHQATPATHTPHGSARPTPPPVLSPTEPTHCPLLD
ncbi:hypothetical protein LV79_004385 [Actinokineospora globicatena]|uniref:Uncharacterized protein n=1 Tax=Actinokineospora globicatena TaxID=103729 RepID=A0A9W6QT20_9PSEU|nr:hypothetical protein [Actinokineospora globicatena]GLW77947.1 hypothetical protein Aglo01_24290 [Actinokineospora globicatena]GLW85386.1 hypothetical protein Aglo02_30260 [Actinokineospora globicatena]GLW94139.1 hypothetical protein Aglo03_49550 [Actinokineospora globicatena]